MKHYFTNKKLITLIVLSLIVPIPIQAEELDQTDKELQTYTQVVCDLIPMKSRETIQSHINIPGPLGTIYKTKKSIAQTSTNWAGYVGVTNTSNPAKKSVSSVAGSWTVPNIFSSLIDTYSAIWIGIDGFSNGTVEQVGTSHDWSNGAAHHYAWFEMYPGPSYIINGFHMNAGDSISATIVCTNTAKGIFTMTLYNNTQHTYVTIPTNYTTSKTAQRSSAEWIMEAPWLNNVLPLSNFRTAHLTNCTAIVNGTSKTIGALANVELTMVNNHGNTKATTSALLPDQKSFNVTWNSAQ